MLLALIFLLNVLRLGIGVLEWLFEFWVVELRSFLKIALLIR